MSFYLPPAFRLQIGARSRYGFAWESQFTQRVYVSLGILFSVNIFCVLAAVLDRDSNLPKFPELPWATFMSGLSDHRAKRRLWSFKLYKPATHSDLEKQMEILGPRMANVKWPLAAHGRPVRISNWLYISAKRLHSPTYHHAQTQCRGSVHSWYSCQIAPPCDIFTHVQFDA